MSRDVAELQDLLLLSPHMLWKNLTQWVACKIQGISLDIQEMFNSPEGLRL